MQRATLPSNLPLVLLVEDSPSLAKLYSNYLQGQAIALKHVTTGSEALKQLQTNPPALVLLDLELPDRNGLEILAWCEEKKLPVTTVVMTGHSAVDVVVKAMRSGAYDFLAKPVTQSRLLTTLRNALERQRLKLLVQEIVTPPPTQTFHGILGDSPAMLAVYTKIRAAAQSRASVFITGESGTGKELTALAIHQESPRRSKPFVALNCAAIPMDLMESEIFGHIKGAFTGAIANRDGAAETADGGTIFLDEICELDLGLQGKLLRFVQSGQFRKIGSDKDHEVNVRLICATNRDPQKEVEAGRFREDLYYRLHVIPIALPPLRRRGREDILRLANHFLARYAREEGKAFAEFHPETAEIFARYPWPGNIRELENIVRTVTVLYDGQIVIPSMLPPSLGAKASATVSPEKAAGAQTSQILQNQGATQSRETTQTLGRTQIFVRSLAEVEREAIEAALVAADGNVTKAAALLGINPSTLYRKQQKGKG